MTAAPPRSAAISARAYTTLVALALALAVAVAVALVPAFVLVPRAWAARMSDGGFTDERALGESLPGPFVDYWNSGDREFPPDLARLVDYWFHYHVAKAVIAALLLIVLVALGSGLWKVFLRAGGLGAGSRAALASAGVLVTTLALFSLAALMANIQGAVAPFSSLLPMLPLDAPEGELAAALDQIKQGLAENPNPNVSPNANDRTTPALQEMISDFSRYHAVIAVAAAIVGAVLVGVSVVLWKRFARTGASDRRTRRVLGSFGVLSALLSPAMIVVAVANAITTADSTPALLGFFEGGW
ncbi:hypothetical protein ACFT9I_15060 [Streptomyces sp. NPDC057137]|uniref:hypothetical protein n=1 Tax=Streptomyces sp. NPDC057137 TaxID=3346030 RepID=UPI003643CFDC